MSTYQTTYDPLAKVWSGRPMAPIYHPNVNAAQVLLDAMDRNPDGIGQINTNNGMKLKNQDLRLHTIRVAQNLQILGIRSGDVVAVMAANHHHLSALLFGSLALAAPVNILGLNFSTEEITHMLGITLPKIVICETSNIDRVRHALDHIDLDIPIYTFDEISNEKCVNELLSETGNEEDFIPTSLTNGHQQAAFILCSSGTTNLSKGIAVSHAMILYQFSNQYGIKASDVYFIHSSMVWITAVIALIATTLMGATRVITTDEITPESALQIFEKYRVSMTLISLYSMSLMLQCQNIGAVDLSSMKRLYCTGSVICHLQSQRMNKYLPNGYIYVVYGLSEASGFVSVGISGERESSVGLMLPGHRIRVLDDNGIRCGPNEEGELIIKGEIPHMGYWNDAIQNGELIDEEGWIRTGDIGRFDSDGFLYITDRKKEMLKYKGDNVSPAMLENMVMGVPGVRAVCVVGVFDKDLEEKPTAIVVRDDQHDVTEIMILDLVDGKFTEKGFLCGGVYFVEHLPKTHTGKIQRRGVKAMATELYNRRCAENGLKNTLINKLY